MMPGSCSKPISVQADVPVAFWGYVLLRLRRKKVGRRQASDLESHDYSLLSSFSPLLGIRHHFELGVPTYGPFRT